MSKYVIDNRMDLTAFSKDLAQALGFPLTIEHEASSYPSPYIECGDGLTLRPSANYGAKIGKVDVYACAAFSGALEHHERPKFPSATVDSSRDIKAIVRDIMRRVVEPGRIVAKETAERAARKRGVTDGLKALCRELEASFPGLQASLTSSHATSANLYFNRPGNGYLSGSLQADGTINIQRLSLGSADDARRLFAILSGGN
jgi:hypothetical protein